MNMWVVAGVMAAVWLIPNAILSVGLVRAYRAEPPATRTVTKVRTHANTRVLPRTRPTVRSADLTDRYVDEQWADIVAALTHERR